MTWSAVPHNLACLNPKCDLLTVYWVDVNGTRYPAKYFTRDKWPQAQTWIEEHTEPEKETP